MLAWAPASAGDRRPNVVVLLIDDMGYGDPSCFGNPRVKTPQIDSLATEGLKLTNFYVNSPICSAPPHPAPDRRSGSMASWAARPHGTDANPIARMVADDPIPPLTPPSTGTGGMVPTDSKKRTATQEPRLEVNPAPSWNWGSPSCRRPRQARSSPIPSRQKPDCIPLP